MLCSACGAENLAERRFCLACGQMLARPCPQCAFVNEPRARFCGGCGLALEEVRSATPSPEAPRERRHAVVLFADLAGYTRLSRGLDPEALSELMDRVFGVLDTIVTRHGGRVDKHIGDCVMAIFGAPLAHGNEAERSAAAALAMHEAMPGLSRATGHELALHIGMASGEVLAGESGSDTHRQYTVTGDTVNLAARLTDRAAGGQTLVAAPLARLMPGSLSLVPAGKLELQGFESAADAFLLVGKRKPGKTRRAPLVGRDLEQRQLGHLLDACRQDGQGQLVVLRGEAGIGKTRLVEALQELASARDFAAHCARILDFGDGRADPLATLARSLLGLDEEEVVDAGDLPTGLGEDRRLNEEERIFLGMLLRLVLTPAQQRLYDAMDNGTRQAGRKTAAALLLEHAARKRPQLLIVEDLHWAERASIIPELAALAETLTALPVMLVLTTRLEGDPLDRAFRVRTGGCPLTLIDLGPLRAAHAQTLAAALAPENPALAARCIARAAGNPLYLEHLLRHALDGEETSLPGSVQSLVQARIDALDPEDRQAVQAASILGQHFPEAVLRLLVGDEGYEVERLADRLLLRPQGANWMFTHALVREGVYATLTRERARRLHEAAAAWYAHRDPLLHAEHLGQAGAAGAAEAFLEAARIEATAHRSERALVLVEKGLALAVEDACRCRLLLARGALLHDLGRMAEALEAYRQASLLGTGPAERCRARIGLARVKRVIEDVEGAFADLAEAERFGVAAELGRERAEIRFLRGNLYFPRGEAEACERAHGEALALARRFGAEEIEVQALGGLGDAAYMRGRMASAHRHLSDCVALARRRGLARIEVANFAQTAHTLLYLENQSEALARAREATLLATRIGHTRAEVNARTAALFALFHLAEPDRLREEAALLGAAITRIGAERFEQARLLYLGLAARSEGAIGEARQLFVAGLEAAERTRSMGFHGPQVLSALASVAEDPKERDALLERADALSEAGCVGHAQLRFYPDVIDFMLRAGEIARALLYADRLEAFTRDEPLPWSDVFVTRARLLAAARQHGLDEATRAGLETLRARAEALDLRHSLPLVEEALAA